MIGYFEGIESERRLEWWCSDSLSLRKSLRLSLTQRVPDHSSLSNLKKGVAEIFMEVEPVAGKRHVAICERRTRKEWARQIKQILDERYPEAIKVRLVMDNLNTHNIASLYEAFDAANARRLAERLEIHYTPKHESWLNMAEIELSTLKGQCLNRRIPDMALMQAEVVAREKNMNNRFRKIAWQFKTENARAKRKRLYPKV